MFNTKPILEVLYDNKTCQPDKTAFVYEHKGQVCSYTYSEFWKTVVRSASYIRSMKLPEKSVVIIKTLQSPLYFICYYAVQMAGLIPSGIEKNTSVSAVDDIVQKLDASAVISTHEPSSCRFININTIIEDSEGYDSDDSSLKFPDENELQMIMFTTGTTGSSKGVELTYRAMTASEEKVGSFLNIEQFEKNGLFVTPTPLNHAKGVWETETMLRVCGTVYIVNGLADLRTYFNALDYPCDKMWLSLVPANLRMLTLMAPDEFSKRADRITAIKLGTAALLEDDKERISGLLPDTDLHNPYGSSEAGMLCSYNFKEYPGKAFCIGKPLLDTEVIFVDENKNPVESSSVNMGKLAFRTKSVMNGYYNAPELTKEAMCDGIVYTNDFGYMDDEGFVYVHGRADDVINVGGIKVAPDEVESAAYTIDGIRDCICISTDDQITGCALKLLVVLDKPGSLNEAKIKSALQNKIERIKFPKTIEETDHIERMYNGKINRKFYRTK